MDLFNLIFCCSAVVLSLNQGLLADPDAPLFLTEYIETNRFEEGRKASEVMPFLEGVKSYSGLLTVDKVRKNHMFFWYFPALEKPETAPLLVWLNGYSTASTYGVFQQNGPYEFKNGELSRRELSWEKWYHTLYIDNPVGVGYSYTETANGYSKNLINIASNLFETLTQFYKLFPELKFKDLYLCGISTAGKYIPSLAYRIYQSNKNSTTDIKLKGIFIGNPFLDPSQINYGSYLYELGLIDFKEKLGLDQKERSIQKSLRDGNYEAFYQKVLSYIVSNKSYILNITGVNFKYDYTGTTTNDHPNYLEFINKPEIKRELHVGNVTFNNGSVAMSLFAKPYGFSVKPWLEELLKTIKMVFYNGQRDIMWAYPMMSTVLSSLKWNGDDGYRSSNRIKLYNGSDLSGYLRNYDNLTDALILNAPHNAIKYQPQLVLQLLNNLTQYSSIS